MHGTEVSRTSAHRKQRRWIQEDGTQGRVPLEATKMENEDDPVAAAQLALILVNPRLSNLHSFVLRSGRQAARLSPPQFTTGIFRVSSQGTRRGKAVRSSFHVDPSFVQEREKHRRKRRGRRIDQLDDEKISGVPEIEISRQNVNEMVKKRTTTTL